MLPITKKSWEEKQALFRGTKAEELMCCICHMEKDLWWRWTGNKTVGT